MIGRSVNFVVIAMYYQINKVSARRVILLLAFALQVSCTHNTISNLPQVTQLEPTREDEQTQPSRIDMSRILWDYIAARPIAAEVYTQVLENTKTPPTPDSIAEAVLVIAVLYRAESQEKPLHDVASEFNFDILQALATNPFLTNYPRFLTAVSRVLANQIGDSDFYRNLETLLLTKLKQHRDDLDTLEMALNAPVAQQGEKIATEIDVDLFRSSDNIVLEADSLANQGEYQSAIKKIATLDKSSPLSQIAQEKLTEISNKAVHDLRKRAAFAFQKAGPISDISTREAYLTEAQNYLEQALTLYPQAENLDTVRSNLVIIARDLEKLRRAAN